jgi:hypothetical protein
MTRGTLLVAGLVVAIAAGCDAGRAAPDERIAAHHRAMCKIAEQGAKAPVDGVRTMFRYYGEKGPDMARDWADLLVMIERIDDDRRHDDRARQAAKRIHAPLLSCARTFERFSEAVAEDPEASELLEHGVTRLSRTLEILFGSQKWSPLDLPRQIESRVDDLVR